MHAILLYIGIFLTLFIGAIDLNAASYTRKNEWQTTKYLWNFGIISSCDKGLSIQPIKYFETESHFINGDYQNIESGDIVWLKGCFIPEFCREILPAVKHSFVLVISDGDESFPSDCGLGKMEIDDFIDNAKIIHIFAQNYDYSGSSEKVSHLPIGMDFHTIGYKSEQGGWGEKGAPLDQEAHLTEILSHLQPTHLRKKRVFVDFQLADTMHGGFKRYLQFGEDRTSIFKYLLTTNLIDYDKWMRRSDLWKIKGQYAFSISPHGNGLDCHRTWEDLILGCIVIVKSSLLDPMYEGLPVVIVKEWSEITEENLVNWANFYQDAFTNPSYRYKLTNEYWLSKIQEVANPYKTKNWDY
jgi:hypothetical protein